MPLSLRDALDAKSARDAVMHLALGTVDFLIENAPEYRRWNWFSGLLVSDWDLSTRLDFTGFSEIRGALESVAKLVDNPPNIEFRR